MRPVLEVDGLDVWLPLPGGGRRPLVRGVSLHVGKDEVLGLIGESGSGKTMTATAILRLLPDGIRASTQTLRLAGQDLAPLDAAAFDRLRGTAMAMIFQDPAGAFNPAKTIGWHFYHVLRRLPGSKGIGWRGAAAKLLEEAGVGRAHAVLAQYPHQLSGGMLQRALISLVLALRPTLIVADEPTTNLDAAVSRQIIALFRELRQRLHASFIYITHDIEIARVFCDRIAVLYAGQVVEQGWTKTVLSYPRHPYTRALIAASTELAERPRRLREIAGEPGGAGRPDACSFELRCPLVHAACLHGDPGLRPQPDSAAVRCVLHHVA